jgi:hypothetical protein
MLNTLVDFANEYMGSQWAVFIPTVVLKTQNLFSDSCDNNRHEGQPHGEQRDSASIKRKSTPTYQGKGT